MASEELQRDEVLAYIDYAINKTESRMVERFHSEFEGLTGVNLENEQKRDTFKESLIWLMSASRTSKAISCAGLITIVGGVCTGFLYVLWAGIKHMLLLKGI